MRSLPPIRIPVLAMPTLAKRSARWPALPAARFSLAAALASRPLALHTVSMLLQPLTDRAVAALHNGGTSLFFSHPHSTAAREETVDTRRASSAPRRT